MAVEQVEQIIDSEIIAAARRLVDEAVRLTDQPIHDGTRMVLVPEGLFSRLERAIHLRLDYAAAPSEATND